MAASTLYTLLVKLGFDIGSLKAGSKDAQVELAAIGQAAKLAAASASPAAAALTHMSKAATMVAGSSGATAVLRNLSGTLNDVLIATKGSANALNSVAGAAHKVAAATGNGTVVNNYAKAVSAVTTATKGSVTAITDFTKGVANTLIATNGSVSGLNRFMTATVAAAQGASDTAGAIQAVAMAAKGGAPSLQQAAGATQATATATAAAGNAAAAAAPKLTAAQKAAVNAAAGMNVFTASAIRAVPAIQHVGDAAETTAKKASFMQRTLSMAFAFGGGVAVTTVIGFIGNALLGFNSRLQQAHIAFTTLLGDSGMADKFITRMKRFAEVTPFEFDGLEQAVQRLLAMGFTAEQALPTLRAVGDAVAGLGGSTEKLDRVTIALGQMMTAGRVNAQDMRQLTEAGIPAWLFLADAIGKTLAQTRKMAEEGLIPASVAIPAILEGMDKKFGGLMAKQARTAAGAFSTIRDAALQTISGAIEPLFNAMTVGLVGIADFLIAGGGKYIVPFLHAIGIALAVAVIPRLYGAAVAAATFSVSLGTIQVTLMPLIAAVALFGLAWQENFGGIRAALEPALSAIASLVGGVVSLVASSGLLVPILTVIATLLAVKFVAALVMSAGGMLANAAAAIVMSGAFGVLTASTVTLSTVTGALGAALKGLLVLLGGIAIATVGLFAAALVLLLLNFDRVAQGVRVLSFHFVGAIKNIVGAASALPIVGALFKGLSEDLLKAQLGIAQDMAAAEADIKAKQAAIEAAKDHSSEAFGDESFQHLLDSFKKQSEGIGGESQKLVDVFGTAMDDVRQAAANAGGAAMSDMAKGIREHQNMPLEALKTLHEMVRNQLSPQAEIARLYGTLISQGLAEGLRSDDPAVLAQAEATKKLVTERLDELTNGAYSAGQNTTIRLAAGLMDSEAISALAGALERVGSPIAKWIDSIAGNTVASGVLETLVGGLTKAAHSMEVANDWNKKYKPSADAVADAMKGVNDELSKTARSEGLSRLNSAFSEISSAAHRFFDKMHQDNLKLIDDAVRHKNAILDAKQALNQAPVTAAQEALDFQRQKIQEWRLREAVRNAQDPAARRDAILALQDFLAQVHIDEMQAQVDKASDVIDLQKEANNAQADALREAENERYRIQQESFDQQLELLRRYLEKHPGEWQNVQGQILELLNGYGIDYQTAGSSLGAYFVQGLWEQVEAAREAAKAMADVFPGVSLPDWYGPEPFGSPGGYWPQANSSSSGGGGGIAPGGKLALAPVASGGGTVIVQIGEEKVAEIVDRSLYVQDTIYGQRTHATIGNKR